MRISHPFPVFRACPRAGGGQFVLTLVVALLLPGQIIVSAAAQDSDFLRQGLERIGEQDTLGALTAFLYADSRNAAAHYNAGTLALERGELGTARIHLETASRLAPFSKPISHNLTLAYKRLGIAQGTPDLFEKTWRWIVSHIGLLGLVLVTLGFYLASLVLLRLRKRQPTPLATLANIFLGLIAVSLLCFSIAALWNTQRPEAIAIAEGEIPLYAIPNPDSPTHGSLQPGHSVWLLDTDSAWTKIRTQDRTFWVPSRSIEQLPF